MLVRDDEKDAGDGDALAGCALPPLQTLVDEQGAHVPALPEQNVLPRAVEA